MRTFCRVSVSFGCKKIETMHQFICARHVLAFLLTCVACTFSTAQYGDLGLPEQPADTASVDDIIFYGDYMDMSGGYNVNDTVYNFTAYDFDGNPIELYEELAGPKPVVLVSGSVSCIRFRNVFDPSLPGQEVWSARNFIYDHIEDFNWIFIYGVEAHPTDGNCPSNCPPTVNTDTAVVQPSIYAERRWAMHDWLESPIHDFPFTMYADNPDNAIYNTFFQRPFGMIGLNCDGTVAIRSDWVTNFFADSDNVDAMLDFRLNYNMCTIDWEPEEDNAEDEDETDGNGTDDGSNDEGGTGEDDTDDDEPIDYDGPDYALEGHTNNEVASNVSEATASDVLRVYPNPARTTLTVASNALDATWQLTDMRGRAVANWTQTERLSSFDIADLPRGQYVLIGRLEDGSTTHQRVILH